MSASIQGLGLYDGIDKAMTFPRRHCHRHWHPHCHCHRFRRRLLPNLPSYESGAEPVPRYPDYPHRPKHYRHLRALRLCGSWHRQRARVIPPRGTTGVTTSHNEDQGKRATARWRCRCDDIVLDPIVMLHPSLHIYI